MRKQYLKIVYCLMMAIPLSTMAQHESLQFTNVTVNTKQQTTLEMPANQQYNGKQLFIVQFNQTPSVGVQMALSNVGIELLNYIPNKAYFATCPVGFDGTKLAAFNVHALIPVTSSMKMHQRILQNAIPDYAMRGAGLVEVNVALFHMAAFDDMIAKLQMDEMEITKTNATAHSVSMILPSKSLQNLAAYPFVQFIEPVQPTPVGETAGEITAQRSNCLSTEYAGGLKYNGAGVKIGVGDNGFIYDHLDMKGRYDQSLAAGNNSNHATYVTGAIGAAGNMNPVERSAAWGAMVYTYQFPGSIDSGLTSYDNLGISITNNSIGENCNDGYTLLAQTADMQIKNRTGLMHIFSSGDNGNQNCGFLNGWGNITGGTKQGKNVITVGSVSYDDVVENASSRGPATDGRVEPMLVATGKDVTGTAQNNGYATASGTSGAAAATTAVYAQLTQAYNEMNSTTEAPSALLKAALLNGADDIGNPGPDFTHGFGRVNARRSLAMISGSNYQVSNIAQGDSIDFTITIPVGTKAAKMMLYWNDVEALVNVTPTLVNDLDLKVIDPATAEILPLGLNSNPNAFTINLDAIPKVDHLNNQEQVVIVDPVAGTYTMRVSGYNIPLGTQEFVLVYDVIQDDVTLTYPIGGETMVPGEVEYIRWDSYGDNGVFDLEYSTDNGNTWNVINTSISGNQKIMNWPVPATITGEAKVRVTKHTSNGNFVSESTAPFNIIDVPTGITWNFQCLDSVQIAWNPMANATAGYQVWMLGANYMDSVGFTATDTFLTLTNVNPYAANWWAVSAYGAANAKGRKSNAVQNPLGLLNCPIAIDAGITNVTPATGTVQSCFLPGPSDVKMDVTNYGLDTIYTVDVGYILNGGAPVSETISLAIAPGQTINHVFGTQVNIAAPGVYNLDVYCILANDGNEFNDTVTSVITVINAPPAILPYSEDFETFTNCSIASDCEATVCPLINGMVNAENLVVDDADFRVNQGGTPTPQTGPQNDHTLQDPNGHYIYFEASNCFNKWAHVMLPCVDLTNAVSPVFSFWYHMAGQQMGDLHLDIYSNNVWINDITLLSGNQGNNWQNEQVALDNYIGQVVAFRFRGMTLGASSSDMAIDDIGIGSNSGIQNIAQAPNMLVQPNPATDIVNITVANAIKGGYTIQLVDMQGRIVKSSSSSNTTGAILHQINVNDIAQGVYNLRIENEGKTFNHRLVIQ